MLISLNWINDYVDLEGIDIKDIWYRFTMSTAEVEEVTKKGRDIKDVVVGYVVSVADHPNSKKLKVCKVNTGNDVVQSLCGAPNIREGIKVPFAGPGGSVKGIPDIRMMETAGIESMGVICSPRELGISDLHEGVMVLPDDYETGRDIRHYLDIDDVVIEIDNKSLTNRPDLWGHYGIAREFAAIFKRQLKQLEVDEIEESINKTELDIVIEDSAKCRRYCGLAIANVKGGTTPLNMQIRLYYCGMRPIEPIVDLTNYIMLETGQPMHAFDRRFIQKLVVSATARPVDFVTLDGNKRRLPQDVLMICNNDEPVAIAGIMGGENSEISESTEEILLESANFEGSQTRKSSTLIGLRTEASARFEKSLDPYMTGLSIKRFVHLLKAIKPDIRITSALTDVFPAEPEPVEIEIDTKYINSYIGQCLREDSIEEILESLDFDVERDGSRFTVRVPSFRASKDVTMKADLVEEITRIYGYDNISPDTVEVVLKPLDYNENRLMEHKLKEMLSESMGFNEIHSYVWYDSDFNKRVGINRKGSIRIINPHAESCSMLRDSMVPSMLQVAEGNARFFDDFSVFEIGSVFKEEANSNQCEETKSLCILSASRNNSEEELFYRLKGIVTNLLAILKKREATYKAAGSPDLSWIHPAKSVEVSVGETIIGYVSVVHPGIVQKIDSKLKIAVVEVYLPQLMSIREKKITFTEPSRYQETLLDFSFLVDRDVPYDMLKKDIDAFDSKLLVSSEFVDIYEGRGLPEGRKSMTFRFIIGSTEKTLSSDEIEGFSQSLLEYMKQKGYSLRQ